MQTGPISFLGVLHSVCLLWTLKSDPHPSSTSSPAMENTNLTSMWTQVHNLALLARGNVWYLACFFCSVVSNKSLQAINPTQRHLIIT